MQHQTIQTTIKNWGQQYKYLLKIMKKLAVIKSERGLNMVTKIMAEKLLNKIAIFRGYQVKTEDYVDGKINHIVICSDSHMLTKSVIDVAWEVIDEYEAKYESMCICATIQTRPYLTKDGKYELHMPVIEVSVRIYEER